MTMASKSEEEKSTSKSQKNIKESTSKENGESDIHSHSRLADSSEEEVNQKKKNKKARARSVTPSREFGESDIHSHSKLADSSEEELNRKNKNKKARARSVTPSREFGESDIHSLSRLANSSEEELNRKKKSEKTKARSVTPSREFVLDQSKTQMEAVVEMSKIPDEGIPVRKKKKTKKLRVLDESSSSKETETEVDKKLVHGVSGKKRKKIKTVPGYGDISENVLDESNSSKETEADVDKKQVHGVSGRKRKKTKTFPGNGDVSENILDANTSSVGVKEEVKRTANDGVLETKKKKRKLSSESEDNEEVVKNKSFDPIKMVFTTENISHRKDVVESKTSTDESPSSAKKSRIPMLTDPRLPLGWRRECVMRKTGKTEGQYDVYIFSPLGKKFRSRVELARFLASENSKEDPDNFDFSVYGRVGYHSNTANRKKIKSILESNYSSTYSEEKNLHSKSDTTKTEKLPESGNVKRSPSKKVRQSKEKGIAAQPQKRKARFKYTPTVDEIFKCTSKDSFCMSCGKTGCKNPRVELLDIAGCGMLKKRKGEIHFVNNLKGL